MAVKLYDFNDIILLHIFDCLTAKDLVSITKTCRNLHTQHETVSKAIKLLVEGRIRINANILPYQLPDDTKWPRSLLLLRCLEMIITKQTLFSISQFQEQDMNRFYKESPLSCYVGSKSWYLRTKKQCHVYEQYYTNFKPSKKKLKKQASKAETNETMDFYKQLKKQLSSKTDNNTIVCQHNKVLPHTLCTGQRRRIFMTNKQYEDLVLYMPNLQAFKFPIDWQSSVFTEYRTSSSDLQKVLIHMTEEIECPICLEEVYSSKRIAEEGKTIRLAEQLHDGRSVSETNALLTLLCRKIGHPNCLFSPSKGYSSTYYLVPRQWLSLWRKYVNSITDTSPGMICNAGLVCFSHRRTIVPAYVTMFLSGFGSSQNTLLVCQSALRQSLTIRSRHTSLYQQPTSTSLGRDSGEIQYEIVTQQEWDALIYQNCIDFAVGFHVLPNGSYEWNTPECKVCSAGMIH